MIDLDTLKEAVIAGDHGAVHALVGDALAAGMPAVEILESGLLPAMDVVGERFGAKTMFISEVLLCARAMHAGLGVLKPALAASAASGPRPVVVLGTVRGDLHDIGKNLVAMMLEAGGFDVVDLGTNVPADKFVDAVRRHRPAVVGISALLTSTMREMRKTLDVLRQAGVVDGVRVVVGGAPVTEEFAKAIGADGWAPDAPTAVARIKALLN